MRPPNKHHPHVICAPQQQSLSACFIAVAYEHIPPAPRHAAQRVAQTTCCGVAPGIVIICVSPACGRHCTLTMPYPRPTSLAGIS